MLQQEKLASIGQLAAGMAHEINNPVGFVISNLNTLKENARDIVALMECYQRLADLVETDGSPGEGVADQLAVIESLRQRVDIDFIIKDTDCLVAESLEGAKRVQHIVQNLRDFTHPGVDAPEGVDLNNCLDTTLILLSKQLPQTVSFRRDYGVLPPLTCHLREMNQALFNILKNAVQAVAKDDDGDGDGEITIRTRADKDVLRISISDNGQGMPPETAGRVFDPFFTTREVGSGAGLGLTQAYNSVRSHGGQIEVQSRVGAGSTFIVILPLNQAQKRPATEADRR
jgi:signal transduction histidine kinase